jgi:uncharacterized protein
MVVKVVVQKILTMKVIGRNREVMRLSELLTSGKSELVAVYGRRRVGKTFLVREVYKKSIVFSVTGLHNGLMKDQLRNFYNQLVSGNKKFAKNPVPPDWFTAFSMLTEYLDSFKSKEKKVIFIDEFPWISTVRSGFLMWFENFWNAYCAARNDLIVVICGSSASFMIRNVVNNKGGLHNRLTCRIRLEPFNLYETALFLRSRGIKLEEYDIVSLYMAIGGIPHYLELVPKGKSVAQIIDFLCFEPSGGLVGEFDAVFKSLFSNSDTHKLVVKSLAANRKGVTREDLLKKCKLQQSGFFSNVLQELIESGFVAQYTPFGKKNRGSLFRLTDEYCRFYFKFIEDYKNQGAGTWNKLFSKQTYVSWAGFAFETVCLKHVQQIKMALGVGQVYSVNSSWSSADAQIDLIIDRDDNRINLCEMKFYNSQFSIDKTYFTKLQNKINSFKEENSIRKGVGLTFITTFGLKQNSYSLAIVDNQIKIDSLFLY